MSAPHPLNTSKLSITAEDFKGELDGVLEYVEIASDRYDLPALDDLFLEADTDRYWLLCYAIRFAARCAYQRVVQIKQEMAEEWKQLESARSFADGVLRQLSDASEDAGEWKDDDLDHG